MLGFSKSGNWNECNLNPSTRIHWRASLVNIQQKLLTPEIVGRLCSRAVTPASRAAKLSDRGAAGKTTWNGEGLLYCLWTGANPVASLQQGDLCKAVVTHGKASAGLCSQSRLKGRAKPIR